MEIKNAIIENVSITDGERGLLTAMLHLDYGGSHQGFGGYTLYLPKGYDHATVKGDFAGHFIFRCMQIGGVSSWDKLKGKAIRVKCDMASVHAIGHIVKDDWFSPNDDFKAMKEIN